MNQFARRRFNERFVQRLLARRPESRASVEEAIRRDAPVLAQESLATAEILMPGMGDQIQAGSARDLALETIVSRERPVLFVRDGKFDLNEVTALGPEAVDLVGRMREQGSRLIPVLPLIGRIDVVNFPSTEFLGTAWFVDTDIVVTNRHVASLIARWDGRQFAFVRGIGGASLEPSMCTAHEFDDLAPDASKVFKVIEVLYIEPDSGPHDIAFLRVQRRVDGRAPTFIPVSSNDARDEVPVCVVGYPARASKKVIPDQDLMKQLYRDRYDVKRAAPGFTSGISRGATTHDCTTLGGNSGSVVLDLATGEAVGLHYAGLYQEDNFAVRASVLTDYIRRKRWNLPSVIESTPKPRLPPGVVPPLSAPVAAPSLSGAAPVVVAVDSGGVPGGATVSITVPVTLTVSIGAPGTVVAPMPTVLPPTPTNGPVTPPAGSATSHVQNTIERVEAALQDFWTQKPAGVVAARVGFSDSGETIGNQPCIAASVLPAEWAQLEAGGPAYFKGVPVRYLPADIDEQIQNLPNVEVVDRISYDDDARKGSRYALDPVVDTMDATLHVGPEYSWEVLERFIDEAQGRLVSAMYEFHSDHIKDALQNHLERDGSLQIVLDNTTFSKVNPEGTFDRVAVFDDWAGRFPFSRIVAPEGTTGLISDSYHIKVTVRDDDTFWLSSGNWKSQSSQPIITQQQRDNAASEDLPGNREWHVVIRNKRLASVFRNHILQDFKRSADLGGGPVSPKLMEETLVDVPIEESIVLERRAPQEVLKPQLLNKTMRVRPLLTPDKEGAIYSEAVLELIKSAQSSLLFQIPYIGMRPNPKVNRGYIDDLIAALTTKLIELPEARVLLRSGGSRFSAPTHAAWFFKSKGVDIDNRVRVMEDHHTKGMIVDGQRVLLGSHNWSAPGVTLNRDASLLFDDTEVADYFTRAFQIDWARANPVRPKRFVKPDAIVKEAIGDVPPPGFRRVRLADLIKGE